MSPMMSVPLLPQRREGGCPITTAVRRPSPNPSSPPPDTTPQHEAWASLKSFKRTDEMAPPPDDPGNPTVNFHGERRSNETHASTTDPEARLARKGAGREAKLAYAGHAVIDNRHGLVVNAQATEATGTAE